VLTEESSQFIARRFDSGSSAGASQLFGNLMAIGVPSAQRTLRPPRWLGWSMISTGAVLVLYSLAMKRPD
jgi:hypothetical protein